MKSRKPCIQHLRQQKSRTPWPCEAVDLNKNKGSYEASKRIDDRCDLQHVRCTEQMIGKIITKRSTSLGHTGPAFEYCVFDFNTVIVVWF